MRRLLAPLSLPGDTSSFAFPLFMLATQHSRPSSEVHLFPDGYKSHGITMPVGFHLSRTPVNMKNRARIHTSSVWHAHQSSKMYRNANYSRVDNIGRQKLAPLPHIHRCFHDENIPSHFPQHCLSFVTRATPVVPANGETGVVHQCGDAR